jgi:hypothetical protein
MKLRTLLILSMAILIQITTGLQTYAQVTINEYSASNLSTYIDNYEKSEDWVEIFNTSSVDVNLGGYYLSDKSSNPTKWIFPDGIIISANGFITVWCSARDEVVGNNIHTNFKLKQAGESEDDLVFTDPDGNVIDEYPLIKTQLAHSIARDSDGSGDLKICINPTKGDSNNSASFFEAYAAKPEMDMLAGFYDDQVSINITNTEPNSSIHFTTDGAKPTQSSTEYSSTLDLTQTKIIKAITISDDPNILPSFIEFNTYFINEEHELAILSTSAHDLDDLLNGDQYIIPHGTMEYFNKQKERTSFGYGEYNKHGQDSWAFPHRSFDYITRDEMGYSDAIHEKLLPYTNRKDYQRIIIRASGDDNYPGIDSSAHMRDMFIQTIAAKNNLNVDLRRAERCVVYVNGGFWGVYSIREKPTDHDYTNHYYNQDKFHLYYLLNWGSTWAEYGGQDAFDDWYALHNYAMTHDLSVEENYRYVSDRLDITSLVDYVLINSYVVCTDWITWNTGWWRGTDPEGTHQKWGYILWDEDATFNHYINYTGVPDETANADPCYPEWITSDPEQHITLLNKLKESPEFYQYYVSRYSDLHNTVFKKKELHNLIDTIKNKISFDMNAQIARWGGNMFEWEGNVQKIKNFISVRDTVFSNGLIDCYNLTGPYTVSLNTEPESIGEIKINSITPEQLPWQGSYFGGIETKLRATATTVNYEFDHWELNNHTVTPDPNNREVSLSLEQGDLITAHFREISFSDSLVINEINYKSTPEFDVGDWLEFYNPMPHSLDISDWYFKDENEENSFIFPSGTTIESEGYLVLVKDSSAFETLFPDVHNFIGELSFNLSAGGELLRLFNAAGTQVDYVDYDDEDPWPTQPDGNGPTLELIDPASDNALAESWNASYIDYGTPGKINSTYVSINEPLALKELQIEVYPNPFSTQAVINFNSHVRIENGVLRIYNMYGKLVRQIDNIRSNSLPIIKNNLVAGVYVCKFIDNQKKLKGTTKLIVK